METILLNNDWHYEDLTHAITTEVNLPHDGTISTPRENGGHNYFLWVGFKGLHCIYTKTLFIPKDWRDKVLYLEFEGIYRNFCVTVNGCQVLQENFGFIPYDVRIDQYVHFDAENEIRVELNVPEYDHNRWYCGTGIYQDVYLHVANQSHIALHGIRVTTLSHEPARIHVQTQFVGNGEVRVDILDGDAVIASAVGTDAEITLNDAKLWSAETPHLYTARVSLQQDGQIVDISKESFGIRTLSWNANEGFLVNGKRTILRGGCIHNDNGVIGMIANRVTEERRAKNLKTTGFNALRNAHHPMSPALLEMCDRYGLYVMDESFDEWYRMKQRSGLHQTFMDYYLDVTRRMVRKDYNHPCVVMYSFGNEINEVGSLKGVRVGMDIINAIRALDTTRPILHASAPKMARGFLRNVPYATLDEDEYIASRPDGFMEDMRHYYTLYTTAVAEDLKMQEGVYPDNLQKEDEAALEPLMQFCDMGGYNYYNERFPNIHEMHPDRVLVATETNGQAIVPHWRFIKEHPYAIGDFVWTLQDHIGEANVGGRTYDGGVACHHNGRDYPWLLNDGGIVDLLGHSTPMLRLFHLAWGEAKGIWLAAQPPIHDGIRAKYACYKLTDTIESWSFDGCEGQKTNVDVFTDAAEAEVLVNGLSAGKRKVVDCFATFPCTYQPGSVTAIGYDEAGREIYRASLHTASSEARITLSVDKTVLKAGSQDFAFVNIDITDEYGTVKALPEQSITVTVAGSAALQGLGSAEPVTEESFTDHMHTTCHGRALAVIRSGRSAGVAIVRVSCENIGEATLQLDIM